jgi:hypothetical protein
LELDLIKEEAVLLPGRDTMALLNLNLPINIGVATPVALAISINAATIGSTAASVALNGVHLFG